MKAIVCIDDRNGMMFNERRQSRDRVLRQRILDLTAGEKLWMNEYSAKQFSEENAENIHTDEGFLWKAGPGEYVFVENLPLLPAEEKIEQMYVFKWNREYPGDLYLDLIPAERGMRLLKTEEFAGSSHEKITLEVYER